METVKSCESTKYHVVFHQTSPYCVYLQSFIIVNFFYTLNQLSLDHAVGGDRRCASGSCGLFHRTILRHGSVAGWDVRWVDNGRCAVLYILGLQLALGLFLSFLNLLGCFLRGERFFRLSHGVSAQTNT